MGQSAVAAPDRVVPREFVGLARVERTRLLDAALVTGPLMRSLTDEVFANYKRRNAAPRPDFLLSVEQRWRRISTEEGRASVVS